MVHGGQDDKPEAARKPANGGGYQSVERVVNLSEYCPVEEAREVGFFDELVEAGQLLPRAREQAAAYAELDMGAHKRTKRRIRRQLIRHVRRSVWLDVAEAAWLGLQAARRKG